ncbi:MAG TPA: hypothetical protein VG897_02840 [Terriglobales bacterium]|nr:hypothetical protein [Terriglobales bacterium]
MDYEHRRAPTCSLSSRGAGSAAHLPPLEIETMRLRYSGEGEATDDPALHVSAEASVSRRTTGS